MIFDTRTFKLKNEALEKAKKVAAHILEECEQQGLTVYEMRAVAGRLQEMVDKDVEANQTKDKFTRFQ